MREVIWVESRCINLLWRTANQEEEEATRGWPRVAAAKNSSMNVEIASLSTELDAKSKSALVDLTFFVFASLLTAPF